MSGSLPSTDFLGINFKTNQRTLTSTSDNGTVFTRQIDSQKWSLSLSFPTKTRSDFAPILAFLIKQRSQKETFTITLPSGIGNAQGTIGGSPTGNASAGATSITIASGTGTLKAGDLIKFANHNKVYMVVSDHADCSTGTITIEPPLRTAISTQAITFDSVPMTVRLVSDLQEFPINEVDINGNFLFNFSFDVVEAL